jgi:hypothetical protein
MEYIYILFLVGYYIFRYMSKKQKEEQAKQATQAKPKSNERSLDREGHNPTIEMIDDSERSLERDSEKSIEHRHYPDERTIVINDGRGAPHSNPQEPTLKDIFKQIMDGGGDIFKQPEKPKAVIPTQPLQTKKPVKRIQQQEDINYAQKSNIRSKEKHYPKSNTRGRTKQIWKNTSLKDMIIVKTILDTPYIDKNY